MMKILVPVKRVMDPDVPVRIEADGRGVVSKNMPHTMNPFDEVALTEAAALKHNFPDLIEEIVAVSIGPDQVQETLRTALAMGADRTIWVQSEQVLEPLAIAKILKILAHEIKPDLILMGNQGVDHDNGQVGPMLAGLLAWPQACNAIKILIDPAQVPEDGFGSVGSGLAQMLLTREDDDAPLMIVIREVEDGQDSLAMQLPALVTCNLRLNEPRPLALAAVMKAKRQNSEPRPLSDFLKENRQSGLEIIRTFEPPERAPCQFLQDTHSLAAVLKPKDTP